MVPYGRRQIEGIQAHLNALHLVQKNLGWQKPEGAKAIRRISRSLKNTVPYAKNSTLQNILLEIEKAEDDKVGSHLIALLPHLGALTAQCTPISRAILVVDDNPVVIHLLKNQLGSNSRKVYVAKTLRESRDIISQKDISLVILDLSLPDGDGRDLLVQIRENPFMKNVPVIVASSSTGNEIKAECFALGADAYFQKPFDPIALSTAIAAKLQRFIDESQQSSLDPVTRLPNRLTFYRAFAQATRLAARTKGTFAIAIIDLDRFKSVNDLLGHQMGDHVLQTVASLLLKTLRTSDVIARWGGEEFAVLFPDTDLTQSRHALEKVLKLLRGTTFKDPDKKKFRVTFSAGLTSVERGVGADEAMAQADRYLYLAKISGRNHVIDHTDALDRLKRNILLVEDDEFMAVVIRQFLEEAGFRVYRAKDGKRAMSLCSEAAFSLITLDVQLPDTDGFSLLQRFRENHAVRHVPVIMLTSQGAQKDVVRGFRLRADDYVVKPFSPPEFLARVNRFLQR